MTQSVSHAEILGLQIGLQGVNALISGQPDTPGRLAKNGLDVFQGAFEVLAHVFHALYFPCFYRDAQ